MAAAPGTAAYHSSTRPAADVASDIPATDAPCRRSAFLRAPRCEAPDPASKSTSLKKGTRANEIDLLWLLAALSVVCFGYTFRGYAASDGATVMHFPWLAPYTRCGYLGVELFSTIGGFAILMTAASRGLRRFAISRAARL